jgi:cytidine deaminase
VIATPADAAADAARRLDALRARVGQDVAGEVAAIVSAASSDELAGSTIPAALASEVVARHGLGDVRTLALLALPVAQAMARAPISGYQVAAVGIEARSGDLVLGANLEFPGSDLWTTVHAEGFVALRARRRGQALAALAVRAARPCAHCRQTLAESEAADALVLVDLAGREVRLAELYPEPFRPAALGVAGDTPGAVTWPSLVIEDDGDRDVPEPEVAAALREAGSRAHAPYSRAPSAVAVRLADGRVRSAGCVESVAFNPTVTALQAALVEVSAARAEPGTIVEAWLGRTRGGPVDPEPGFRSLLAAVAPNARAGVLNWQVGA